MWLTGRLISVIDSLVFPPVQVTVAVLALSPLPLPLPPLPLSSFGFVVEVPPPEPEPVASLPWSASGAAVPLSPEAPALSAGVFEAEPAEAEEGVVRLRVVALAGRQGQGGDQGDGAEGGGAGGAAEVESTHEMDFRSSSVAECGAPLWRIRR